MTLITRMVARAGKLPPAETHNILVERDLPVTMPDGVVLLANRYVPRHLQGEKPPLILVRSCYGRSGFFGVIYGRLYAERGFQVLIESTRGTFGSGGTFNPFQDERADGLATVAWLKTQPWFPGSFVTNGASYLGFVQWALASEAGPELKGLGIQISTAEFHSQSYPGGSFSLDTMLNWISIIAHQEQPFSAIKQILFSRNRKVEQGLAHLPLADTDKLVNGTHAPYFQTWLEETSATDPYWQAIDFTPTLKDITAEVNFIGGWYDIFLPWMLNDYQTLRAAGKHPRLTIGPWAHSTPNIHWYTMQEILPWFKAQLQNDPSHLRAEPVHIFVTGANVWRDYSDWPPANLTPQRRFLQPAGLLASAPAPASEPDHYRYDPADPTPALAGPLLTGKAQPTDNRSLEARADVLTYTSTPLEQDLEVIGPVQVELFVTSSTAHTDFFARLCDLDKQGVSINVCDALIRIEPDRPAANPDGTLFVSIELWPTAHRFLSGHSLRLQISSGAHPRYARNPGSGEPLPTASKCVVADQAIYHDPTHQSVLIFSTT